MAADGKRFRLGEYEIDIIVHGFPGKSVCHGSLGFSTIALVRHGDRLAIVDVGSFGQRALLIDQLAQRGLTPQEHCNPSNEASGVGVSAHPAGPRT